MEAKFLESLGGKLGENWATRIVTPALLFWAGGLLAWVSRFGWAPLDAWLATQSPVSQIFLVGGAVVLFSATAIAVDALDLTILRLLEGYWPRRLRPLRDGLAGRYASRNEQQMVRFQELMNIAVRTPEQSEELVAVQQRLSDVPAQREHYMPTSLGNLLRASERRVNEKYGLEVVICWPRLWLVMSDGARKEVAEARMRLDLGASFWLWGVLFALWSGLAWWAAIVAFAVAVGSYRWLLNAAGSYGVLLESSFDVGRAALYKATRWPLPANPSEERTLGRDLTSYLWSGSDSTSPDFSGIGG